MTIDFVTSANTHDVYTCLTCHKLVHNTHVCPQVRAREFNTLTQAWGHTMGLTMGTLKFKMQTRTFKWVSRAIMFPLVFLTMPVSVVGLSAISFALWRVIRGVLDIKHHISNRKAHRRTQGPKPARTRSFKIEIKIG